MATEHGSSVQKYKCIADCWIVSGLLITCPSAAHIHQQCVSHKCQGEEDDDLTCVYNVLSVCLMMTLSVTASYGGRLTSLSLCVSHLLHDFWI